MSAPEEEDVAGSCGMDDLRQSVATTPHHDVGNVGRLQVTEVVVHNGSLTDVVVYKLVRGCGGVAAALHEDLSGIDIALVVSQVVLDDEHNMVVGIAVIAQQLVHSKGIGLVAIVAPCGRGTDHHCPTVGDCREVVVDGHVRIFGRPHLIQFPERRRRGLRIAALSADVQNRFSRTAALFSINAPEHIVGAQNLGISLVVEVQAARSTCHVNIATGSYLAEGTCQSLSFPSAGETCV